MSEQQRHIIHTQEWQLQVPSQERAREIHAYFGQLSRQRLLDLLDRHLSERVAPDEHLQIDTLELDLGEFPAKLSETAIWQAFEAALEKQFPARPQASHEVQPTATSRSVGSVRPPVLSSVEAAEQAIVYFLQSGQLPWWSQESDENPVAKYLTTLIHAKPPVYLTTLLKTRLAQQRLVAALPAEIYRTLLLALLPSPLKEQGVFILEDLLTPLLTRHASTARFTRQRLLVALLRWSMAVEQPKRGVTEQVWLWKSIAQILELTVAELTKTLEKTWASLPSAHRTKKQKEWEACRQALLQLSAGATDYNPPSTQAAEDEPRFAKNDTPTTGATPNSSARPDQSAIDRLSRQQDRKGQSTEDQSPATGKPHSSSSDQSDKGLEALKGDALEPSHVKSPLTNADKEPPGTGEIDNGSADQEMDRDLDNEPSHIKSPLNNTDTKPIATGNMDKSSADQEMDRDAIDESKSNKIDSGSPTSKDAPLSSQGVKESPPVKTSIFSSSEELITQQAGLVLLAPFLPHFFGGLDLWRDGEWAEEIAQHRAVHLLHHLATGADFPPEYETALPKVMSALSPEELLLPTEALSEEEQQACLDLLSAAIGHAPILKNMSPDGLRGSFLIRNGLLSRRDRHWYVQVERQTYDIVLDHIPWSFGTLKLPWINDLISVEW